MKDDMKLEMQAGSNIQLDHIKEIMKENIPDLLAENQRLKEQLKDYENALKEYAHRSYYSNFYDGFEGGGFTCEYNGKDYENNELAEETLKKWGK